MENSEGTSTPEQGSGGSVLSFLAAKKIGASMWVMRIYILFLSIQFMLFSSPFSMEHYFQRAMLANAVVCALRIHQRIPSFQLSRTHFANCLQEDSAHYLIYSFIFLPSKPMTLALVPIAGFALLHTCSFTRQILDCSGPQSWSYLRRLINAIAKNQAKMFQIIAMMEVVLFPTCIFMLFAGGSGFMTPVLYYKFLQYRYLSKRNPYSRLVFYEMRVAAQHAATNNSCPRMISGLINQAVNLICRLSPRVQ